ncbi:IgGFc-binding protein-like [Branchiostoma floridae x Branchiostoma japonicum]
MEATLVGWAQMGVKTCTGSCVDGFAFDTPATVLTCDPSVGTWTPTNQFPNCRPSARARSSSQVATPCDPISPPMSGSYSCSIDHLGRMSCTPSCMDGFEFETPPAAEYVCEEGTWSPPGPYPNCVFAGQKCEKIPPPFWGSYRCQTDHTGTERCYPSCMEGYEFESPPAAEYVCVNGQFSPPGPYPNCRKSEALALNVSAPACPKLVPPVHGSTSCRTDQLGIQTCVPACNAGYSFLTPPAAEYICLNGYWAPPGPIPDCVPDTVTTTTVKPATTAAPPAVNSGLTNIGNECLGDTFCGDRVTCSAWGDPHYTTFDGKKFNFQGNCKYVLSRGMDFQVSARNVHRRGNTRVSFVDAVEFELYGNMITITQGKEVYVNGVKWSLPICLNSLASITQQGNNIVIDTALCVTVTYDGNHRVTVELPPELAWTVGGLCGNANGNQGDDLIKPDMTPVTDPVEFGNSWTALDDVSCPAMQADQQFDITQADQAFVQELESQQFCGHLQDTNSPFSACFAAVEPTEYVETCVYDMAASGSTSDHSLMCENFEEYVRVCAAAGVHIDGWREQTGCDLQCPPNAHYSYSTSACQDSCRTPTASSTCGLPNVEGCECDPGYIWSGMTCVEPKDCGCLHEGNYHTLGEVWGTEDGRQCECLPNWQVSCAPMSCLPGAEWGLQDGVYGCHQIATTTIKPTTTTTQTPKPTTTTTQTPKPTTTPTPTTTPAAAPTAACEMQADIVFVVDGSASIPANEFEKVKTFLNNVVGHFDISPTATQVGVVQYSTSPQQEFALNAHSSLVSLQQAISNIAVISRGTSTGSALTFARDQALTAANGARPGVPKIVVVVTDGRSGDDVILPSENLHNDGVITFAIGVTESINYQELSAIAGRPDHISTVFDFDALEDIMEPLSSQLCEVETTTLKPTTTTTQTPKPTTTTTQTPKPTTTPTPPSLPTPAQQTTTMKPVTPQEDAPMSNDVVNIGNECLGDVFCGDRVTCSARGDPHYNTFDGKRFNFQGNCKYVLSRGKDFMIAARNYNRRNNMRVSFVDEVEFTLYGSTITITRDKEVFVNGVKWALPCCIGGFASITQQGNYIVIDTILCITVKFGANHHVIVELPAHLAGLVHGMCGDANGIQGDDLVKPDTTPATDAVEFGNSWVAPDDMMSCPTVLADQQFDITQADQAFVQELESQQFCGHLQDINSLFSACFAAVEPTDFIEDCVYDMAASGNTRDTTLMCDDFEGYVQECAAAGIHLEGWREQTGCALQCPPNAHYSYSTSACQDSCRTPTASSTCGLPNVEGCECDPGYIWSGMTCVEPKDCGCLHEGNYHALGEQWGTEDGQHCECQPNFQAICAPMSCLPGAEWSLQDGVFGCHQVPTLKPTTTTTQTPKPTTTPNPPPSTAACEMQADIVFVVDGSASIPAYEFEKVKTFLNNVVAHFDISPTATQVGVVQYSTSPQQEFALNAHSSLVSLQQAISNIAVISRGTSTGSALTFARDQALTAANGARPGVPKIVVVVTDGRSGDDVILPSQNLHNDGVITFAIGVTESINYQELSAIAGRPDHISTVFDFDALEDIMEPLSSQLCEVETTTLKPTTTTTQTPKPTTTTTQTPKPTTTPTPTTTTQTPKPTTTPTPSSQAPTLPTLKPTTTTMKPASEAPVAPVSNDVVNIGNECLGDVLCGDRVTCSARGDPHYRTFDGKRFNFQGNCKYVLSRGQDFVISARNANRRGNMRVSFVDAVEFTLHGHIITITQGKEVFVNGVKWTLPICLGFASITQQGNNIVIDTTLCITVTFDGNHHVTVQLPAHLAGLVGGLCGNANGIQGDDLVKPDTTPAQNAVEFGNSWVAPDDMSCPALQADQQFDITQADQAFVQELESQQFCGHLQDTNSPFSACFAAVEPSDYIDDCVYDMAASGSTADHTLMCENFEGYVQACAAAGIHLDGWREQAGCTLQCPPNSHYSYSTSACQDSCRTPTASSTCGLPNVEGCECDPGYIWSGMTCVEPKDCGCLHEGNYHALGEQWGTWDGQHCECQPNFQVICAPMSCQPGAEWGLQDGVWGCHQIPTLKPTTTTTQTPKPTTTPTPTTTTKPTTTLRPDDMPQTFDIEDSCIGPHTCPANVGMCTAFGDPHYQTFDGKGYFFQGACKYTLVRHQNFNVAAKNGHRMGDTRVSFVDAVELTLYGHTIWLLKDREVMIDGVRRTLPVCLNSQATIRLSGDMVVVETDMCVTVKYDGDHRVEVEVPPEYASLVDGLCGNFNGNPDDELLRPDQTLALNEVDMGNSWLAPDDAACLPLQEQFDISTVDQALLTEIESVENCGQITDISGAFQPCINVVNPLNYFDACVYDMAAENGDHEMLCNAMEAYVDACANAGVVIVGWRDDAHCFQQCPPNAHYSHSTSACQDSCRTPTASSTCGLPNVEGCECDPGYIWSGMTCVEPKDCGCLHEMDYHTLGEQWGTEDGQHCACQPNFQVTCVPMACLPGAEWSLQDGVYGCHQVPTLKPTTTTTQTPKPTTTTTPTPKPTTTPTPRPTTTTTQSPKPTTTPPPDDMPQTFDIEDNCIGHVTCPATVAMCTAFGDPHYQTFDGKGYFFQGACKYTLVRHGNFNVAAKNGHRMGDTRVSFVDAVELSLYGHTIWLLKNREVMIDGVRRTLPVCLNSQATIRLSGDMVMVETDMCVTVKYDGDHRVEVEVPPDYAGQVDGLCGNFNGNPDDELLRPDQTPALNEVDMGNSWLAPDDLACQPNQEQFDISTVDQAFMGELESTTNCGQITDVNGAFQPCIDYVNPANYFDACVYDMAAENGDHEMMCNAMEAYADACAAAGVVIVGWRDESLCGVDCPPNSHYSLVTACPATCANPLAPMRCSRTTLPGCACDEGYVLSGDRCVRAEECGCLQGNQYYALGEEWGVESTGQLCVCMSGGTIQCLAGIPSCDIEEQWSLQDGVLGCHPVNTPCDMKADIVFVVESSSSVPPTEFDKVRSFLKHVVEKVTIGADATQIAVVSYSSFPSLEFALHEHDNVFELKAGINNIRHIGLGTATGAALGFAGDVVLSGAHGARPGVPKIVVLITASGSEDDMALAAQTLHSRGVTVHAIGVGSGLSPAQLQQVASSPVYASTVIDFSGLGSLKEVLPETLCQNAADVINSWLASTTSKPTTKPTTTSRPDDPPVADAGLDQTVQSTQTVVMLDGTGSHDDHGIISFLWQYPDQHLPVTLGDTSSPTLAVANLVPGEYTFTLTVTDASGQQDTDDVTIVVNKPTTPAPTTTKGTTTPTAALDFPPVAFAGADEVVHLPQNTLTLDGSLSTDDHGIVSYQWEYVDHKLPVDMVGTLSSQLQLSNLHPGEYTFVLTVTDTAGQQSSDDVLVIVQPEIMTVVNPLHPDQPLHDETFQAHAPGTCSAVGDPHYHTFDGKLFSFSGDCWYVLAKNKNPLEEQFAVLADNARCDIEGWEHEACTRAVKVQYRGSELLLTRDSISLNGQTVQAPISHNGNTVEKIENSYFHKVTLDNGLEILWDSHTRVYVKSPGTLQAKTAGLCGDFNGNPEDDFTTPSGSKVLLADTFAQSWKYGDCTP